MSQETFDQSAILETIRGSIDSAVRQQKICIEALYGSISPDASLTCAIDLVPDDYYGVFKNEYVVELKAVRAAKEEVIEGLYFVLGGSNKITFQTEQVESTAWLFPAKGSYWYVLERRNPALPDDPNALSATLFSKVNF